MAVVICWIDQLTATGGRASHCVLVQPGQRLRNSVGQSVVANRWIAATTAAANDLDRMAR
jgi:hypothetical protein